MKITLKKKKIKSPEEEIKKLKNDNTTLRENILIEQKIIKNLSGNNERKTANTLIKDKTKQNNEWHFVLTLNNPDWQTTHSTETSNNRQRRSNDILFETSKKFAPLLMENIDDFTAC